MAERETKGVRLFLRGRNSDGTRNDDWRDITAFCSGITMQGQVKAASRTLNFDVVRDEVEYYLGNGRIPLNRGDGIILRDFTQDDAHQDVFYGLVWEVSKDDTSLTFSAHCYDSIKFLMTSSAVTCVFVDKTPVEITETVCKELGVTFGQAPECAEKVKVNARGKSGYEAIMIAWTELHKKTGKFYYPRMVGYKLHVIEKGEMLEGDPLYYRSQPVKRNLISIKTSEDSSTAVTALFERNEKGTAKLLEVDKGLMAQFGYIVGMKDSKQESNQDDIAEINDGKKTVSVEAIGDWAVQTGWSIALRSKYFNSDQLYIESDTHTYINGIHTMQLELSYENSMDEVEGESFEKKGEFRGGNTTEEYVWNFLRAEGFSAAATAGVLGNMKVESGVQADINEYGVHWYGKGYGLVQWTNTGSGDAARRTRLENWCAQNGYDVATAEGQMNYLIVEFEGYYESRMPNYRNNTSPEAAASEWLAVFEGCPHHSTEWQRQQNAREYYDRWKDYDQIPIDDYGDYGEWDGELSGDQQRLIDIALNTGFDEWNMCAKWVSIVFGQFGISISGHGCTMTADYCHSNDPNELAPGMLIGCVSWPDGGAGATYGHIAIYIGNDTVLSPECGTVRHYTVQEFIGIYNGGTGVRWGWAGNQPLY